MQIVSAPPPVSLSKYQNNEINHHNSLAVRNSSTVTAETVWLAAYIPWPWRAIPQKMLVQTRSPRGPTPPRLHHIQIIITIIIHKLT